MPAESANGMFAINAIQSVPINDARHVAIRTAFAFIPASLRMLGLTARMYAIVIKVVIPAAISVFTVVLFSFNLKNFSNINFSSLKNILCGSIRHTFYIKSLPLFFVRVYKNPNY